METLQENEERTINIEEIRTKEEIAPGTNLHIVARHIFLILCVLLTIFIFLFLIYQNGKSIYDNGI